MQWESAVVNDLRIVLSPSLMYVCLYVGTYLLFGSEQCHMRSVGERFDDGSQFLLGGHKVVFLEGGWRVEP